MSTRQKAALRDGAAQSGGRRRRGQHLAHHRGREPGPRRAEGGRGDGAGTCRVGLSAGGPAVPLGHAFPGRPLDRPPQGGGARNHLDRRLSGIRRRPYLQFGAGPSGRRRAGQSSQGLPAQLPGIRREALLHAGDEAHGGRAERHQGRNSGVRGHLGARARRPGARRRRPSAAGDQCLPLRGQQAESARERSREGAGRRNGHSAGLRQSARRAGRTGLRRQFLRDGCARAGHDARAGVYRGPVSRGFDARVRRHGSSIAGRYRTSSRRGGKRLRRPGPGHPRLRRQAPLSRAWCSGYREVWTPR